MSNSTDDRSHVIDLYKIELERMRHEGVLFWTRYSAFFVIVAGLAAAYANSIGENDPFVRGGILVVGAIASLAWSLATYNGIRWQEYFNTKLRELEESPTLPRLYTDMESNVSVFTPDVVSVASALALASVLGWLFAAFQTTYQFVQCFNVAWVALISVFAFYGTACLIELHLKCRRKPSA